MKTFHYVDSPAASGKTRALVAHAIHEAQQGRKIVIAQPSKDLLKQTRRDLRAIDATLPVTALYSTADKPNAVRRISSHLEAANPLTGEILLITHQALARLEMQGFRSAWQLFVDEVPGVFDHVKLKIRYTHNLITDHLMLEELVPGISVVRARDPQRIDDLIEQASDDENIETFRSLLIGVRDPHRMVCIKTATWSKLIEGDATRVDFFTFQLPSSYAGWNGVTFLGANAHFTELMVFWKHLGLASFKRHDALSDSLAYEQHTNGERLTLHYLFNTWSKDYSVLPSADDADDTVLEAVGKVVSRFFDGRFIWQANKGNEQLLGAADIIPHMPHGLNRPDMMACHNVALLAALNHDTAAFSFLLELGLTEDVVKATVAYQVEYQTAMRCSLRDPKAIAPGSHHCPHARQCRLDS